MIRRELTLTNRLGLHARAAARFVHTAGRFACAITVEKDGEVVEGKSILGLLLLAAPLGSQLAVVCDGSDELEAADALTHLIVEKFGESE